jgi:sulfotransferase
MSHIYAWLGLSPLVIDPQALKTGVRESDSHYRMKYLHTQSAQIVKPPRHAIPPRIQARIEEACDWYYRLYYPPRK